MSVYLGEFAEQAERYDEIVDCMKEDGGGSQELCLEERNLLSVAYRNEVGSRSAA